MSTHNPGKPERAIDCYVTLSWSPLCAEVAKLRVTTQQRGRVVTFSAAEGGAKRQ
jgi:hypothetical protein